MLPMTACVISSRDSTLSRPSLPTRRADTVHSTSVGSCTFGALNNFVLLSCMDVHRDTHSLILALVPDFRKLREPWRRYSNFETNVTLVFTHGSLTIAFLDDLLVGTSLLEWLPIGFMVILLQRTRCRLVEGLVLCFNINHRYVPWSDRTVLDN